MKLVNIVTENGLMKLENNSVMCSRTGLVVDTETNIVYYKYYENGTVAKSCFEENPLRTTIGYMCPYLGKHGRPCHFIDGKIVEISASEMLED